MSAHNKKLWVKIALILTVASASSAVIVWGGFINPYKVFRLQENQAISQYDVLNDTIFHELPEPPEGAELLSKGSGGISSPTNEHGRLLRLAFSNGNLYPNDIFSYYEDVLTANGWQQTYQGEINYFRNTSCISIIVYNSQYLKEYYISIWHDFVSQDFSPKLPPLWLLQFYDFWETDILTCPPN